MSNDPEYIEVARQFTERNNYELLKFIGKGAFKETYKIITSTGELFALKILDPTKCNAERTKREIRAAKICDSPYLSKIYDDGSFRPQGLDIEYTYIIEDYFDGGSLAERIKQSNIEIIFKYALYLSKAIEYLSGKKIVHRDIKPENIMFRKNSDEPILIDFGIVRDLSNESLTQTWIPQGPGTPYYSSPEQLNNEKHLIDWRSDQFSLGIVIGLCVTGKHPFNYGNPNEITYIISARRKCSPEFQMQINMLGLQGLLKMIEPWPIHRYLRPDELFNFIKGVVDGCISSNGA